MELPYWLSARNLKLSPLYSPLWTNWWQLRQSGTCLRLIFAIFWSNWFSFTLRVFMCLRWCISTFWVELQFEQEELIGLVDLIVHLVTSVGSVKDGLIINFIGDHFKSGFAKLIDLLSLFLLRDEYRMIRSLPIFLISLLLLMSHFLQRVLLRLSFRSQWIFLKSYLLSTKL